MVDSKNPRIPVNNIGESRGGYVDISFRHDTTFNVGDLIPLYATHTLPNDNLSVHIEDLLRTTSPPVRQTMDYLVQDTYAFWCKASDLYSHVNPPGNLGSLDPNNTGAFRWTAFMGENVDGSFVRTRNSANPQQALPAVRIGSRDSAPPQLHEKPVSNYFGHDRFFVNQQTGTGTCVINSMKYNMYRMVYNEFFRDWNFQAPLLVSAGDVDVFQIDGEYSTRTLRNEETGAIDLQFASTLAGYASVLPVNRLEDYFSRAVPAPQKFSGILTGSNVGLPVFYSHNYQTMLNYNRSSQQWTAAAVQGVEPPPELEREANAAMGSRPQNIPVSVRISDQLYAGRINTEWLRELEKSYLLWNMYEVDAYSPRYVDIISNHFGIKPKNSELNRPIFLGKIRKQITPTQVENQQGHGGELGEIGAFTKVKGGGHLFSHHFDDYGVLMILTCVRCHRSYQTGIHAEDRKFVVTDFHKPVLNNLPYQPIWNHEIAAPPVNQLITYKSKESWSVFGWCPAWEHYRFAPDMKTGQFLSRWASKSLDEWHYADYVDVGSPMVISSDWLIESPLNMSRTLSITDWKLADQLQYESLINVKGMRPVSFHKHEKGRIF